MTDYESRRSGVTQAAWGCLALYLDINLNTLNLLPDFLGYFLMLLAIEHLKDEDRDFALLRPLGVLLTGWHLAQWLLGFAGIATEGKLPAVQTLSAVISLYFCFQFYTDFAKLAARYQPPEQHLDRRILRARNILTIFTTFLALPFPWNPYSAWQQVVLYGAVFVGAAAGIYQTVNLFALRKRLCRPEPGEV